MNLDSPGGIPLPPPEQEFSLAAALANPPPDGLILVPSGVHTIPCDGVQNYSNRGGLKIKGNGMMQTFIQRDPSPQYAVNNQPVLRLDGDDCAVNGLTLDAGGAVGDTFVHACLEMHGRNATAWGVRGIRPSGVWPTDPAVWKIECFAFFITGVGAVVNFCRVEQVPFDKDNPTTYVEGFSVNGQCLYCHVEFPVLDSNVHPPFLNGYQFSGSNGATFQGCTQNGGNGFVYTDTGSDTNVRISGCRATNVHQGIIITRAAGEYIDGLMVDGNIIELLPTCNVNEGANGIALSGPGDKRNVSIRGNLVRYVGGVRGPIVNVGRLIAAGALEGVCDGILIQNNRFDEDFAVDPWLNAIVLNNTTMARATAQEPT